MTKKKLYRSKENKIISGLLAGLGGYMDIDPSVLRLSFIFLAIITGVFPLAIAYFIAVLVIPYEPERG